MRRKKAVHGTRSKYVRGCCCARCRRANNEYQAAWDLRTGRKKYGAAEWERIRPKAEDNPHGTVQRYDAAKCRCAECREANRLYRIEWREEKLRQPVPAHLHGTSNAYHNYGCRCEKCRAVNSLKCAEYKRQKAGV